MANEYNTTLINSNFEVEGNLGGDPEIRYTATGRKVANFSIAVNSNEVEVTDRGISQKTDWYRVIAWEQYADFAEQHLSKGMKVFVSGRLQERPFTHPTTGEAMTSLEVVARDILLPIDEADAETPAEEPAMATTK